MKPLEDEQHDSVLQTKTGPVANQERPFSIEGRQVIAGRYAILGQLGRGGMGEVWHAFDLKLRVDVALKSLRTDRANQDVESLRREVRSAREVISPNVCRIFDLVVEGQQELVSMEYIDGITLAELLQKNGPLELQQAADIASQFLSGLQAIHQAGLVHRDFKPENVMITRTGRVVVMDFGIAKPVAQFSETISGTPSYMAPEQLTERKLDPRSDLFAAGVVLAEMIASQGVRTKESREALLAAIRQEPLQLPDHPWKKLISQAVNKNLEHRFASAAAMSRALEEVIQRTETSEDRKPYPGLAAFTESDAEFFFGRELEVEAVIKKLQELHMMAIIGPSGAGKTSFLHAGLILALPKEWGCIVCHPGDSPNINLAHALVDEFSGDKDTTHKMLQFAEIDVALSLLRQWRNKHAEVVLIVDRFEELFTLNNEETQAQFVELLGRAALEADVHILLAMRDDFLLQCHRFSSLTPIFNDLTPMLPLGGSDLCRAIVQPAFKCGYHFENDSLVEEIFSDVEKERGALPLVAFAVARLWEKRDRQSGLLTQSAYQEIGGVAGALAQHAENTMERIGADKHEIVREIFRNLITAQNTRAARDTEELLSVFSNRKDAEGVLRALIDARLLTSFEIKEEGKRRVEIVHESLLSAWPRLVRWQTQDADSAQLRDQFRQAAQMWQQRGRAQDLLWTGTAFLEFQAWRQRYPGGLSTTEEAFAQAMVNRATRRRRQRRFAAATTFVILLGVLAVVGNFWRGEKSARKQAVSEAQRAEASKLLAIAQVESESDPSAALAYAIKSLELFDTFQARLFALKMTQDAPPSNLIPVLQKDGLEADQVKFSLDGKWLSIGGRRSVQVVSRDGRDPKLLHEYPTRSGNCTVDFNLNSKLAIADLSGDIRIISIADQKEIARWKFPEGRSFVRRTGNGLYIFTQEEGKLHVHFSTSEEKEPQEIGEIPLGPFDLNETTLLFANEERTKIYAREIARWNLPPHLVLEQSEQIQDVAIHPDAKQFATFDATGVHIWSIGSVSNRLLRTLQSKDLKGLRYDTDLKALRYDPMGKRLAAYGNLDGKPTVHLWNLTDPPGTAPIILTKSNIYKGGHAQSLNGLAFDQSGKWIATGNVTDVALWPIPSLLPLTIIGAKHWFSQLLFTRNGEYLLSLSGDGTLRSWPLSGGPADESRIIFHDKPTLRAFDIDTQNRHIAISDFLGGIVRVANLDGTEIRNLKGYSTNASLLAVAFSPSGRLLATAPWSSPKEDKVIRIWNLQSDQVRILGPLAGAGEGTIGGIGDIEFVDENRLLVSGYAGLQLFEIPKNSKRIISTEPHGPMALSRNRRFVIVRSCVSTTDLCDFERIDLQSNERTILNSFGKGGTLALDPTDQLLVTASGEGLIRVGRMSGEEPHIVFTSKVPVRSVAVSPDGRWIASVGLDAKIRLTPMPDLSKPAPHTLPYKQFLAKLKSFTNLRVVQDPKSSTGWKLEVGKFPGWGKVPEW